MMFSWDDSDAAVKLFAWTQPAVILNMNWYYITVPDRTSADRYWERILGGEQTGRAGGGAAKWIDATECSRVMPRLGLKLSLSNDSFSTAATECRELFQNDRRTC
jgi:hypothetical protein